jgi:hypothetical protein
MMILRMRVRQRPHAESLSDAASGTDATFRCLLGRPPLNIRPQPELDTPLPEVDYGPWHVGVASLVEADTVPMRELEDVGDALSIGETVWIDPSTHRI